MALIESEKEKMERYVDICLNAVKKYDEFKCRLGALEKSCGVPLTAPHGNPSEITERIAIRTIMQAVVEILNLHDEVKKRDERIAELENTLRVMTELKK